MSIASSVISDRVGLRAPIVFAFVILLGFGLLYSLLGTGLGRVLFPAQARGSVIERDGVAVGSSLIAQPFVDARYFQPRPSAAGYNPTGASGSNMARSNPDLVARIEQTRAAVATRDGVPADSIHTDLLTQSGGGLDPHVSPASAQQQAARVAAARGLPVAKVQALVDAHTQAPQWGLFGAPRVNVLELNLALDAAAR